MALLEYGLQIGHSSRLVKAILATAVVTRPILFADVSANHSALSAPTVIELAPPFDVGIAYLVMLTDCAHALMPKQPRA